MGERDNHINEGTSLILEDELLTHGHGEKERVVDGEVQPGGDEGDGGGGNDHGGGNHGPWGIVPCPLLLPWRWCWSLDRSPPQDGCQGGGIFVVPFDLGFLSL